MTEKDYSGVTTSKIGKNAKTNSNVKEQINTIKKEKKITQDKKEQEISQESIESYIKVGKASRQIKEYIKQITKKDTPLLELAEKIENKIYELGFEPAFPVNISIDEIAAHYTPDAQDNSKAQGLIKIDFGLHYEGYISDNAITIDLTPEKKYKTLIESTEKALQNALEYVKKNKENSKINEIGQIIQDSIEKYGFAPIRNLSGHSLEQYEIHSGITIPNYNNGNQKELGYGAFAIEPFATTGKGLVIDSQGSNIFYIANQGQVRSQGAREVLKWILDIKKTLPFSSREIEKKFGIKGKLAIRELLNNNIIKEFEKLVEESRSIVSQAECSFIITPEKIHIFND